jgi:curli biogenesis system outer membrane secretion channel CsgG
MSRTRLPAAVSIPALLSLVACASESHRSVDTPQTEAARSGYTGPRSPLAIGKFQNTSPYMRGMFSSGEDRLGDQAKTILETHLSQCGRFDLVDRDNMDEIARESRIAGTDQKLLGADVVVTGQVTEFGRRTTGDRQLFGILGRGKEQVAYCKVSMNLVDVATSRVIYSVQGAGEYALSNREIVGFGGTAGYDSTLNGKVLNLAIIEAVDKLVRDRDAGLWTP